MTVVEPVAFPVMISLSEPLLSAKFALRATVPPRPAKLPLTVSVSPTSLSLPMSIVPPVATCSVPAVTSCAPLPNATLDPAPTRTVSHPLKLAPSAPAIPSSRSVLAEPAPPLRAVRPLTSVLSRVRFPESAASVKEPVSVAPLSTTTLSKPFTPSEMTLAFRLPVPALNLSVSVPAPPCISVMPENVPPSRSSVSSPAPSAILPATVAPVLSVTVALPALSTIAWPVAAPTDAPLFRTMFTAPLWDSVSMAAEASVVPVPPVTVPDTAMAMLPVPLFFALIPCSVPLTAAAVIVIRPAPSSSAGCRSRRRWKPCR